MHSVSSPIAKKFKKKKKANKIVSIQTPPQHNTPSLPPRPLPPADGYDALRRRTPVSVSVLHTP